MTHEEKLAELRTEWKKVGGVNRKLIEQRARLIKWAIEKRDDKQIMEDIKETLL